MPETDRPGLLRRCQGRDTGGRAGGRAAPPGRVAAGKDVGEGAEEAVLGQWRHHGGALRHALVPLKHALPLQGQRVQHRQATGQHSGGLLEEVATHTWRCEMRLQQRLCASLPGDACTAPRNKARLWGSATPSWQLQAAAPTWPGWKRACSSRSTVAKCTWRSDMLPALQGGGRGTGWDGAAGERAPIDPATQESQVRAE